MPLSRDRLFAEVKARLAGAFGPRLAGVILYGSEARGTAGPGSDIDLLVLLEDDVNMERDLPVVVRSLLPLETEYENRCITALPISRAEFEKQEFRVLRAARREGIEL